MIDRGEDPDAIDNDDENDSEAGSNDSDNGEWHEDEDFDDR
jgi:hypothetical protein